MIVILIVFASFSTYWAAVCVWHSWVLRTEYEDNVQSLSPRILFLVIGIQYPMMVIRVSLGFLWSVRSTFGRRKHSISVQPFSPVLLFATPWSAHQAFLSITNTWVLFKFMCMELVMPFNHVIWLWLRGVWECAAGPMLCVPNYMHLECVSSLSWTLCCRIHWWDWVWLSQGMTHAEYAMGICFWTSVYTQLNEKLNVVLTLYSFLI